MESKTKMMGRKASFGICVATFAPIPEPTKAGRAIAKANLKSGFTFRRYEAVATEVPRKEGSLLVPSSVAGAVPGMLTKSAGS